MRKHRATKTTKEFERKSLLALEGLEIIGVGKFTQATNSAGNICLRLLTEVKIYKPDGEVLPINHLWIPTDDNKHNDRLWSKHYGSYRKFRAKITSYGLLEKKASVVIEDLEKDVWEFKKRNIIKK